MLLSSSFIDLSHQEEDYERGELLLRSTPCVLDLKIKRFHHTRFTPLRKYMRQMRKDSATTARSVGFRVCGVKHTRLLVDSLLDIDDDENEEEAATIGAQRRRKRRELRAAIRKRNDDVTNRADIDSEILQLPQAAQQAEEARRQKKMSEENNINNNNSTASPSSSSHSSVDTRPLERRQNFRSQRFSRGIARSSWYVLHSRY